MARRARLDRNNAGCLLAQNRLELRAQNHAVE
jgi:hypothetical protein